MIEKYAVKVQVPALGRTLEFMLPSVMDMAAAKKLMLEMIPDLCLKVPVSEESLWLIDLEAQKRIPAQATCYEAGLRNGSKLMLLWIN